MRELNGGGDGRRRVDVVLDIDFVLAGRKAKTVGIVDVVAGAVCL